MSDVKRWKLNFDEMIEQPSGGWVKYEDFVSLQDKLTAAEQRAQDAEKGFSDATETVSVLLQERDQARALAEARGVALEMIYDKWENGTPCHEADEDGVVDEGTSSLGNAFRLSADEEDSILKLIPPYPSKINAPAPGAPEVSE